MPGAGIVAQAQGAAGQTQQAVPSAGPEIASGIVTGVVAGANAAGGAAAVASATESAQAKPGIAVAAEGIAKEKVEVAALGTDPGKEYAQAKGIEEDALRKAADAARAKDSAKDAAKEVAEEAGKGDDSADIEE